MRIRLTGAEAEISVGLSRLREAFYDLAKISDPYPSDEDPAAICVDVDPIF